MKNIEINYLDVGGYEALYPKTTTENLIDFGEVLYTKEEVDGFIAGLSNQVGNLHFAYGTYTGQFTKNTVTLQPDITASEWITVTLGFQPVGVILSEWREDMAGRGPYAPYITLGGLNDATPVGFAIPWFNASYPVLQATANGFQIRNVEDHVTGTAFNPNLTYLNYIYAYLAFG